MTHGSCVDCNYQGRLTDDGECPRCGSEWTSAPRRRYARDEVIDDLYSSRGSRSPRGSLVERHLYSLEL